MNKRKVLSFLALSLITLGFTSGCAEEDCINLRVYNCEDYIDEDLLEEFSEYEREKTGKNVKVIYDCFDTIESMLSSLDTSKAVYDLICPSEYAIQKLLMQDRLAPFDFDRMPNYTNNCSIYLRNVMNGLKAKVGEDEKSLGDYAAGYMWGTLGIVYNPDKIAADKGIEDLDEIKFDMTSWDALWDSKYSKEMSIKDSMRDTYSIGVMHTFDEEIKAELNNSGCFNEFYQLKEGFFDQAVAQYNPKFIDRFNSCTEEDTLKVQEELLKLRENVYGFECDSGKDDMVKGFIGINSAWSGDAVYAIDRAQYLSENTLYYSLPKTGGNIWFDGWIMPKSDSLHKEEAEDFVDFLSDPANAARNMDYTGYTSFIGGQDILDLVRSWYDPRSFEMYLYVDIYGDHWESSDFIYDENDEYIYIGSPEAEAKLTYLKENINSLIEDIRNEEDYDEGQIEYLQKSIEVLEEYKDAPDMTGSTYEEAVVNGVATPWSDFASENEWDIVDLTYMFEGSLDLDEYGYTFVDGDPAQNPYCFYSDEIETITNEETGEEVKVGRQFYTQYPNQNLIPKLAVMRDFGDNNIYVLTLWENVKSNKLPLWGVIVFAIIVMCAAGLLSTYLVSKKQSRKIRNERKNRI